MIHAWFHWAQHANMIFFTIFIIIISLFLLGFARMYFGGISERNELARTSVGKIRSAPQGLIQLSGKAANNPLTSPVQNKTCCWYHYSIDVEVKTRDSDGKEQTEWQTVDSDTSLKPFFIDDQTGQCLVIPKTAEISTNNAFSTGLNGSQANQAFPSLYNFHSGKNYIINETSLSEDDTIFVHGTFKTLDANDDLFSSLDIDKQNNNRVNTIQAGDKTSKHHFVIANVNRERLIRHDSKKFKLAAFGFLVLIVPYSFLLVGKLSFWLR